MRKYTLIKTIIEYFSVLLIALIVLSPILFFYIYSYENSDIHFHTEYARELLEAPQKVPIHIIAHSAWHRVVIFTHEVLRLFIEKSWKFSAFIVTLSSELLTVGILFWLLRKKIIPLLAGAMSIGLMIIQPLIILAPLDHHIGLGYIWINTYSNPTILLLKPFAILQLFFSVVAFQRKSSGWKSILLAALVSSASVFTKPSYAICLIPCLGILTIIYIWKKKPMDWKMLLIGIGLPSLAILFWQFLYTYISGEGSGIIFAPFLVMSNFSSYLPIKFVLSIVFPLVVTAVYWKEAIKDTRIQIGWIGFGMGAIFTYLFAESGWRLTDGNFAWSGQISLFILFVCCILFLAEKNLPRINKISKWLILSSGSLHVIFGIIVYLITVLQLNPFR